MVLHLDLQESLENLKNYLMEKNISAGYNPSFSYGEYNCDCHQNIEQINYSNDEFDLSICLEVLEHVQNPFKAVEEIKRVL